MIPMSNEKIKERIEYLETQIKLCREDLSVVEKYKEDPWSEFYENSINIWVRLSMKLKDYEEELERLKFG